MTTTALLRGGNDDLLALAADDAERVFVEEAIAFLSARAERREPELLRWGVGDEGLTIFHETTGEEERREADAARAWQGARWTSGFGWLTGPAAYGGRALAASYDRLYRAVEAEFETPDVNPIRIGLSTVSPSLVLNGTDDQIRRFAVGIQRGEVVACQLFSEPDAGSDLANVKTRGVRDGDGWRIVGQKVWTSNAQLADVGLALVRTDPEAPKHRGLTMFLVPMDAVGVEVRPLRQLTGGASFTEVFLEDVFLTEDLRVGEAGEGWRVAVSTLTAERTSTGDRSHGMTRRAAELLRALAERTGATSVPRHRQALADVHVRLEVARCYQRRLQALPPEQLRGPERAIDKLLLADNLRRLGDTAAAILGPAVGADTGDWGTYAWARWILGATGYRLGGGTDEILKTMIGEQLLGLPREPR
jgi:alkylation response protein AidB-like acyl-CoA dehydrogenase